MKRFHTILKDLNKIYPTDLLLLAFTPIIIGFFIDFDFDNSRYFVIYLAWIPLFTIPSILLKNRVLLAITKALVFLIGFIELSHWLILGGPPTLTSMLVVSNTNPQEAIDFFDLKANIRFLILIPYFLFFLLSFKNNKTIASKKISIYVYLFVGLFSILFITENAINNRLLRKGTPLLIKTSFSFFQKIKLYKEAKKENTPKQIEAQLHSSNKKQTFVLIIGESLNRKHMSIYGYHRRTTPRLERRKDIIVFDNVVSSYSNTLNSILSMLSESNLENNIPINKRIDILDIFHSAGFLNYWISNQSPIGIWDNQITVFANKADKTVFVNLKSNSSFEASTIRSYDSKLFKPFISALREESTKKFIVIHLLGNHSSYAKRYPQKFNIWSGNNKEEQIIAEYDNSVYYNDYIIDSLLTIIKQEAISQKETDYMALYVSDHGENVYDEEGKVGHDFIKTLPKANVEIPFILWLSDTYISRNQSQVRRIKSRTNDPYVSDDLFHTILDLNHIETKYFEKDRSLFHPNFNKYRKRVLVDGFDYDKK